MVEATTKKAPRRDMALLRPRLAELAEVKRDLTAVGDWLAKQWPENAVAPIWSGAPPVPGGVRMSWHAHDADELARARAVLEADAPDGAIWVHMTSTRPAVSRRFGDWVVLDVWADISVWRHAYPNEVAA